MFHLHLVACLNKLLGQLVANCGDLLIQNTIKIIQFLVPFLKNLNHIWELVVSSVTRNACFDMKAFRPMI